MLYCSEIKKAPLMVEQVSKGVARKERRSHILFNFLHDHLVENNDLKIFGLKIRKAGIAYIK